MKSKRYFQDKYGEIWSIASDNACTYPGHLTIHGDKVCVHPSSSEGDGSPSQEYILYPSLIDLALAIEAPERPLDGAEITLDQAVAEYHLHIQSFASKWKKAHLRDPEYFPMSFPVDDSGMWFEMINEFDGKDL